jgi:hypothetical protein
MRRYAVVVAAGQLRQRPRWRHFPDRLARASTAGEGAMAYSVRVQQIGSAGTPSGKALIYEADSEMEAVTIAAYEVEAHRSSKRRIAMVWDPAGHLILAYTGRVRGRSDADRG